MTPENAKLILKEYRDKQAKDSSWRIFSRKIIDLDYTKLITNWSQTPKLDLPEECSFPHFKMNKIGLDFGNIKYNWNEIYATAIKTQWKSTGEYSAIKEEYLLFCLENGNVIESDLGLTEHYYNQLGHFIELYKLEFEKLSGKTANL